MSALRLRRGSSAALSRRQRRQLVVSLLLVSGFMAFYLLTVVERNAISLSITDGINDFGDSGVTIERGYLGALISNRVFPQDLFNITAYECKQWIEYMLYAGVQHVYWYDTALSDGESQEAYLQEYVEKGLLTYHRFYHLYPENEESGSTVSGYHFGQDHSHEHFLENYGSEVSWAVELDVDEYPFMGSDTYKLFLRRYVGNLAETRPEVSQILLPCMIFGGNPQGDLENGWVIERYQRRRWLTEGEAGLSSRSKPIFQPKNVTEGGFRDPHQFAMASGETVMVDPEKLRMNHYWGSRLSDFGPDTAEVLAQLVPDASAQPIATELKARTGLTVRAKFLQDHRAVDLGQSTTL